MNSRKRISNRKYEHVRIALEYPSCEHGYSGFEDVLLIHEAISNLNFSEIDTSLNFLGREISMPILISSMTGGYKGAEKINKRLAMVAQKNLIPIGVGSIRAGIEDRKLLKSYLVVREIAQDVPVISNIGIQQIIKDGVGIAEEAVEVLNADALAVHLNKLQELIMPEGEPVQKDSLKVLEEVVRKVKVKVIIKETGSGISREVANVVKNTGIEYIDVGGAGGTSFAIIEGIRARKAKDYIKYELSKLFSSWGLPTALSILEVRSVGGINIIASGGIRSGLDVAKSIVLGSCCAGIARPFLVAAAKGQETLEKLLNQYREELKATMFLVGASSIPELKLKKFVLKGFARDWAYQRKLLT